MRNLDLFMSYASPNYLIDFVRDKFMVNKLFQTLNLIKKQSKFHLPSSTHGWNYCEQWTTICKIPRWWNRDNRCKRPFSSLTTGLSNHLSKLSLVITGCLISLSCVCNVYVAWFLKSLHQKSCTLYRYFFFFKHIRS